MSFCFARIRTSLNILNNLYKTFQDSLEQEEEETSSLSQKLIRLEKLKESVDQELDHLQNNTDHIEKSKSSLQKALHEAEVDLKISKQKIEKLTCSNEETEQSLERSTKELTETKRRLEEYRNDYDDLQSKSRERMKKIRDLESNNEELTEQKERYHNRMNYYETETKDLRKKVNEQTEEIGTLQIESQRFQRERDTHKRNCDMATTDLETHKTKCTETLKRLKDEIVELSTKLVEKDRFAMKQKEQFQDKLDNSQNDLNFLRSMLDNDIKRTVQGGKTTEVANDAANSDKLDLSILKNSQEKFRNEFQNHCNKLEDLLKNSNEAVDTVTVVQSPMSKIKLEELKQIRYELQELQNDLASIKTRQSNITAELTSVKLGTPTTNIRRYRDMSPDRRLEDLENDRTKLNELISRIESRHKAVMTRNAVLLQRTLNEDERNSKDLVKKFQMIAMEGENKQLKTLLGILKKKYDFDENELADELKKSNLFGDQDDKTNNNNVDSDDDQQSSTSLRNRRSDRTPVRSMSTRRPQRNYSFFNEAVSASSDGASTRSTFTRDSNLHTRSSGVSSYSSEDGDLEEEHFNPSPRLPKRYNTLPSRSRRIANK